MYFISLSISMVIIFSLFLLTYKFKNCHKWTYGDACRKCSICGRTEILTMDNKWENIGE